VSPCGEKRRNTPEYSGCRIRNANAKNAYKAAWSERRSQRRSNPIHFSGIRDKALQRLVPQLGTRLGSCGAEGRRLSPEKRGALAEVAEKARKNSRGVGSLEGEAELRDDLGSTMRLFDPGGAAVASHHIVIVAHSMGGLLAHTLVSDSGDALWNAYANRPLNSLSLSDTDRNVFLKSFYFRHQPEVDRVIFLAVPHRGSWLAAGLVGSIANRVIRHCKSPAEAMRDLEARYPGILTPYFARVNARGGPTSLFTLAPNPLLDGLASLKMQIPFHSIIGDRGIDDRTDSSDGIVSYTSAHLDGAESEKIVPAGHNLLSRPKTVAELKRILEENLAL